MKLGLVGISHKTAAVEVRERAALPPDETPCKLAALVAHPEISEALLLSTCNRAELYVVTRGASACDLRALFAQVHDCPGEWVSQCLYERHDLDAVRHLFRVTAGMESLVLGEPQIAGQVRQAFKAARAAGAAGPVLSRLGDRARAVSRRVRAQTCLHGEGLSVASVAVDLAAEAFGDLAPARVLVVGAGETGAELAQGLAERGARDIVVTSRTHARAADLARRFGARAVPFEHIPLSLAEADIVLSCTSAPRAVITAEHMRACPGAPGRGRMILIDLAVPRDVEPAVGAARGIRLYDIDDLRALLHDNEQRRRGEPPEAERIIEDEARAEQWCLTPVM